MKLKQKIGQKLKSSLVNQIYLEKVVQTTLKLKMYKDTKLEQHIIQKSHMPEKKPQSNQFIAKKMPGKMQGMPALVLYTVSISHLPHRN